MVHLMAWVLLSGFTAAEPSLVPAPVLVAAGEYCATTDPNKKAALATVLDESGCDPVGVVQAMRPRPAGKVGKGYYRAEHFLVPQISKKHPDDLLYYVVPDSYDPNSPTALAIVMHGGAKGTERTMADWYMRPNAKGSGLGKAFADAGIIAVGPSAPISTKRWERWCLPEADQYIRDVIIEFQSRFNIDPNQVFLIGHSMGGFGAYQHIQVQPDRFAAVLASAGSWYMAYWPVIRGTPLWIVHGLADSEPGGRPHYTDIAFARLTSKLLTEQDIAHELLEHPGKHSLVDGINHVRTFIARMPKVRRNPFHPHVVVVTPCGWLATDMRETLHSRWLSILEVEAGNLTYASTQH